ncbi:MAG: immune inhibitor A, partial [Flavobacteriales bacterium]|nr:immune inhibitor A [Flavobacteriales bacterium]
TDSPGGNDYADGENNIITLDNTMDLSNAIAAHLTFWAKWDIEAGFDYVQLQVSVDGGSTWIAQCGKYTSPGTSNQDPGNPVWDGTQNSWVKEQIDLGDYLGQTVEFRFRLISDNFVTGDGFYFDDFEVVKLEEPLSITEGFEDPFTIGQNMPNPSTGSTYINYKLPYGINKAALVITNSVGQIIQRHRLNSTAKTIEVSTQGLSIGTYLYFIEADGMRSASKRMVIR